MSSEEFEQLFMLARHLKKSQSTHNDENIDENGEMQEEENEEMAMKEFIN